MKEIIYELAYLISGQIDEIKAQELAKTTEKMIEGSGAVIETIDPKKIKLAYPIKKQEEAFLVSADFTTEPKSILLLSKEIEKQADILRFLIIKKSPKKPEEERAERRIIEEKPEVASEPAKKEKTKKEKVVEKEHKEEDLKKIEKDLDEILGQ